MINIIKKYINTITVDNIKDFGIKNGVYLNDKEIYTVDYVLKNELDCLINNTSSILSKYENDFSVDNFIKIKNLIIEYKKRYKNYL